MLLSILVFKYCNYIIDSAIVIYHFIMKLVENSIRYLLTIDYSKIISQNKFNAREQAISIWILTALVYMIVKKEVRKSLVGLIQCALNFKFILVTIIFIVYNVVLIIGLNRFGLWNMSLLKDSIVWFMFSGIVIVFKSVVTQGKNHYYRNIVLDNLKLVLIVQFILSEYTMKFWFEFISIPIFLFIGGASVIIENRNEYKNVKKLLICIQNILFIVIIYNSFKIATTDIKNLGTYNNLLKIIVPSILSILSIAPAYLLTLYSAYETIFIRLNFYKGRSRKMSLYLKLKILLHCNINLKKVNSLWHNKNKDLFHLTDKKEITSILS